MLVYHGRFVEAIETLRPLLMERRDQLGAGFEYIASLLIESLYLEGGSSEELARLRSELESGAKDPRLEPGTSVALALAAHRLGDCRGQCATATEVLDNWQANGSALVSLTGRLQLGLLVIEHRASAARFRNLAEIAVSITKLGIARPMRWWLRRLRPHAAAMLRASRDAAFLVGLVKADPEYWIAIAADLIPSMRIEARAGILEAIEEAATPTTSGALKGVDGSDVLELRRRLVNRFASPVFIRSFGPMEIHKAGWESPGIPVSRKRMRLLLGLLLASQQSGLTRDEVLDILWPDSDPGAAVNSLNQTVFQLRRLLDEGYKEGESPQYLMSSTESVQLNPDLVVTDVQRLRKLSIALGIPNDARGRTELADEAVRLVRGEFLADVKYEDWAGAAQTRMHSEVRDLLLPIANGELPGTLADLQIRAGHALIALDPFDELAHIAVAKSFASTGRRAQARDFLTRYTRRLQEELAEEPSDDLRLVAALVGAGNSQPSFDSPQRGVDLGVGTA